LIHFYKSLQMQEKQVTESELEFDRTETLQ